MKMDMNLQPLQPFENDEIKVNVSYYTEKCTEVQLYCHILVINDLTVDVHILTIS